MTAASTVQTETRTAPAIAVSVETLAYVAILLGAIALRAIRLDVPALAESEARQAFAAWRLLTPETPGSGAILSPVTFATMALSFAAAGASTAMARLPSMLAGVVLVFMPLLFRERLGRLPTLIATALLAISPSAVAASRQVGGFGFAMLGMVLALAALAAYFRSGRRLPISLAAIALGTALLADSGTLAAVLAMLLGAVFAFYTDEEGALDDPDLRDRARALPWRTFFAALVGTLLIASTLFFLAPNGLGAAADLVARFAGGLFRRAPDAPWVGLVLLLYEGGLLLFGMAGIWLASQSSAPWQRFLAGWGFAALMISLVYPGALPGHALWAVIPLAPLAAIAIDRLLAMGDDAPRWAARAHAAGTLAFLGMILASLSQYLRAPRMLNLPPNPAPGQATTSLPIDIILVVLWVILLFVLWLTVASMWEPRTAWRGLGFGLLILMFISAVGQSAALAFNRAASPYEAFNRAPSQPGLDLLVATARDIGELAVGQPRDASITVQASPDGALAWGLRDFTELSYVSRVDPTVDTVMVITPAEGADPALGSSYVGQDFVIARQWIPRGSTLPQFIQWVLYRTAPTPTREERVILWVREDIYRIVPAQDGTGG